MLQLVTARDEGGATAARDLNESYTTAPLLTSQLNPTLAVRLLRGGDGRLFPLVAASPCYCLASPAPATAVHLHPAGRLLRGGADGVVLSSLVSAKYGPRECYAPSVFLKKSSETSRFFSMCGDTSACCTTTSTAVASELARPGQQRDSIVFTLDGMPNIFVSAVAALIQ